MTAAPRRGEGRGPGGALKLNSPRPDPRIRGGAGYQNLLCKKPQKFSYLKKKLIKYTKFLSFFFFFRLKHEKRIQPALAASPVLC